MNGFLDRLAARARGDATLVRPRPRARLEPAAFERPALPTGPDLIVEEFPWPEQALDRGGPPGETAARPRAIPADAPEHPAAEPPAAEPPAAVPPVAGQPVDESPVAGPSAAGPPPVVPSVAESVEDRPSAPTVRPAPALPAARRARVAESVTTRSATAPEPVAAAAPWATPSPSAGAMNPPGLARPPRRSPEPFIPRAEPAPVRAQRGRSSARTPLPDTAELLRTHVMPALADAGLDLPGLDLPGLDPPGPGLSATSIDPPRVSTPPDGGPPEIHVHIGRVEVVQATPPAPAAAAPGRPARRPAAADHEAYLAQRRENRR
jgi:hypothetical protein